MRFAPLKAGIFIIIILSLITCAELFTKTGNERINTGPRDQITQYEERFAAVRAALPARGAVGYITEAPPEAVMAYGNLQAEYYLTQYAVAPVVVDNNPRRGIVIGNFHSSALPDISAYGRFSVIMNAGNGVFLLRNEDAPS
ncbi:MAG: hypothetical protein NTY76_05270 [Candidatus Omnitrophica bacterium]|nr:hypothetical protein [Candidatus Omnitrophota bacterium]